MTDIPAEYQEVLEQGTAPVPSEPVPDELSAGDATPAPAEPADDSIELYDGYKVDRPTARQLADFRDWIQTHPSEAQQFAAYLAGQLELKPKAPLVTETAPPEEDEGEVPPRVRQLEERISKFETELGNQQNVMAMTALNRGKAAFAEEHQLSPEDLERVATQAGRLHVIDGIMQDMAREGKNDAVEGVRRALEAAYWSMDDMRASFVERAKQEQRDAQAKSRKLAGIGGTSGSVPRERTTPLSADERRTAMVAEIAAAMGRQSSEE